MTQLNLHLALQARDRGINQTAAKNAAYIETMRGIARMLAEQNGFVTSDDLRPYEDKLGVYPTHPNARGAVFCKCKDFEFAGYTKSKQVQGHGNLIRRWKLK